MKPTNRLLRTILLAALIGFQALIGCRSTDVNPARYRITRATQLNYNSAASTTYRYDERGRLSVVTDYESASDTLTGITPTAQTTVYYQTDAPDNIDHADRRLVRPTTDPDGLVFGSRRVFSYDRDGRLLTVSEYKALAQFSTFKLLQTYHYDYGSNGLPATLTIVGFSPSQPRNVYTYTFENGNAVRIRLSATTAYSPVPAITEATVSFDDASSVYYHFFAVYPGITSFNRNNVVTSNTVHERDERGLLVRRTQNDFYGSTVTTYIYEAY